MTARRVVAATLALFALLAPLALAQDVAPPQDAQRATDGGVTLATWAGAADARANETDAGAALALWFAVNATNLTENATARVVYVNVTDALGATNESLVFRVAEAERWAFQSVNVTVPENATGAFAWTASFEAHDETANETVAVARGTLGGSVAIRVPVVEEPGLPTTYLIAGAAVLVVGGAAAIYGLRQRAERQRIARAPRRSQALREQQLESRLERAQEKKRVEEVEQIQQEIRQEQVVREKRRELQILEAKRADALKTLELLKKRHEAGGLTKLQYDNMVAKKKGDLERIEAEIAEMERQDSGAAA